MRALTQMSPRKMTFFPNLLDIVIAKGATVDDFNTIFIVMELEEFDLNKLIKLGNESTLDKSHVKNLMYNLLCAVNFLSTANVIHRDIKPGNILMNKFCQIRICDFGLARTLPKTAQDSNGLCPQIIRRNVMEANSNSPSSIRGRIMDKI